MRVGEISGDAQLERPLTVGVGIATPSARSPPAPRGGAGSPAPAAAARTRPRTPRETALVTGAGSISASRAGGRARRAARGLDRIEKREKAAPRVADDRERVDRKLHDDTPRSPTCTSHVTRLGTRLLRPPAAALVVEDQFEIRRERQELRQQIRVIRPGTAVQHQEARRAPAAVRAPVERTSVDAVKPESRGGGMKSGSSREGYASVIGLGLGRGRRSTVDGPRSYVTHIPPGCSDGGERVFTVGRPWTIHSRWPAISRAWSGCWSTRASRSTTRRRALRAVVTVSKDSSVASATRRGFSR